MRTKDYVMQWMSAWCDAHPGQFSTEADYRGLITNYIVPRFGGIALNALSEAKIRHGFICLTHGAHPKCTPAVARKVYILLREILACAVKDGALVTNPCTPAVLPCETRKRVSAPEVPDANEIDRLLAACKDDVWGNLIRFAWETKLPQSQILAICEGDVDLPRHRVHINKALMRVANKEGATKTQLTLVPCKQHSVLLTTAAEKVLRAQMIKQNALNKKNGALNPEKLLFTNTQGTPIEANVLRDHLYRTEFSAGVRRLPFKALSKDAVAAPRSR